MYKVSVVLPTYNEVGNIDKIVNELKCYFQKINVSFQLIFVDDDSPDGTFEAVRLHQIENSNIKGLLRIGRRGLSSAILEGMVIADSEFVIVMDSDMQHDHTKIEKIIMLLNSGTDLVVCCRNFDNIVGLSPLRKAVSEVGNYLVNSTLPTKISDPLTGFFGMRKHSFMQIVRSIDPIGFKVLYEIVIHSNGLKISELKFDFKERYSGVSKLSTKIFIDAFELLLRNTIGKYVPEKFIIFAFVGLFGAIIHMALLYFTYSVFSLAFVYSQAIATLFAMIANYINNNFITFRECRVNGGLLKGFVKFFLICSFGGGVNLMASNYLFTNNIPWLVAGLIGALIGSVWNYMMSRFVIWKI